MRGFTRPLLLLCLLIATGMDGIAQTRMASTDTVKKSVAKPVPLIRPKPPKPITHEFSMGLRLNTNGWGIYSDIGRAKTKNTKQVEMFHDVSMWQIEIGEKKDQHEKKINGDNGSAGASKYIYGKINNFYVLKLGWGYRKMLVGKPESGTVSIHWMTVAGASLGMLKPYYLNVYSDPVAIRYEDATQSNFLDQQVIAGSAGFSKGLNQMKFIPGGQIRSGVHFDFSTNKKNVLGVETGFNLEYYSKPVPVMAGTKAVPYFADLFIAVQFGRRW